MTRPEAMEGVRHCLWWLLKVAEAIGEATVEVASARAAMREDNWTILGGCVDFVVGCVQCVFNVNRGNEREIISQRSDRK